jgi:hypothetical protein
LPERWCADAADILISNSSTENKSRIRLPPERRFGPFFLTQFLGAFNDIVRKNALVILVACRAAMYSSLLAKR